MKFTQLLTVTAVATVFASTANAETLTYGGTALKQPYVGIKVGRIDAGNTFVVTQTVTATDATTGTINTETQQATVSGDTVTGYGVYGGYNFDKHFGVEAEFLKSDKQEFARSLAVGTGKFKQEVETYGAYGTFRHNFGDSPFYAKAKLGVARTNIDIQSTSGSNKLEEHKTGTAYGLAAGYQAGKVGFEASFSRPYKAVDVVSVGANIAF